MLKFSSKFDPITNQPEDLGIAVALNYPRQQVFDLVSGVDPSKLPFCQAQIKDCVDLERTLLKRQEFELLEHFLARNLNLQMVRTTLGLSA